MFIGDSIVWAAAAIFLILVVPGLAIAAFRSTRQQREEIALLRTELHALRAMVATRPEFPAAPDVAPSGAQTAPEVPPAFEAPPAFDSPTASVEAPAYQPPDDQMPDDQMPDDQMPADPMTADPMPAGHPPMAAEPARPARTATATSLRLPEPAPRGLEQRLGARGFVWLGGACIALAGAFLVKYSIDEGLLGPATRVTLGVLLGIVLLVAGDFMRRGSGTIGQALAAAGIADLYASLFAAVALYHLLPAALAFVILAAVTFLAIALALRHGPFVGLVGLAGGFLTPAIVSTGEPNPGVLFSYLYLLQLGALWLERQRGWWYLPAIAIAGGLGWAFLICTLPMESDLTRIGDVWVPCYLILVAGSALCLTVGPSGALRGLIGGAPVMPWSRPHIVAMAASLACGILMLIWLAGGDFRTADWVFLLLLAALGMAIGRKRPEHDLAGFALAVAPVLGLLLWNVAQLDSLGGGALVGEALRFLWIACLVGALLSAGGFGLLWGAARPERWSLLSALGGGAVLALAYWRLRGIDLLLPWSITCLGLSALHLVLAERLQRWRFQDVGYRRAFGVHVLACAGFIAAAVPLWVERDWLAVLWSLLLPLTAWVANKIEEPWLRRGLWVGAPAVLLAVLDSGFPAGERPIFNWLAYGLGVPMLSFAATAWLVRRVSDLRLMLLFQAGALILGFLLVTLEIRHLFHGAAFRNADLGFAESGTLVLLWSLLALATWRLAERRGEARLRWIAYGLGALAAVMTAASLWVFSNPLLNFIPIDGPPVFNTLLYVYGSGFVLFLAMAQLVHRSRLDIRQHRIVLAFAAALALIDGFVGISAINRHLFHGEYINFNLFGDQIDDAELYGYSLGWLLYGGVILVLALWRRLPALRHAAAAIVLLVVLKVFLVDAAGLTGLYRVASFLGLGLTLLGLAWLYQRYVLKRVAAE